MMISCASTNRNAGSLSDAMDKASDDHQGDRKITAVKDPDMPEEEQQEEDFITFEERNDNGTVQDEQLEGLSLGFSAGSGILSTESFYGMSAFSISLEQIFEEKRSAFIEAGGFYSPLQTVESDEFDPETDKIVQALEGGIFSLYANVRIKFYTTPEHTFLGNYFGAGAGVHSMFWSYRNELEINEYDENGNYTGTDTVKSDQLWGLDLNASAGLNVVQTDHFVMGIEFIPGVIIWGPETYQGFTNDVFAPFLYLKTNFNFMVR